jgi:hypothetical protein
MGGRRRNLIGSAGVVLLALIAGGALPGEMRGCGTDLSDEVDHVEYCRDRCEVLCERVVTCGLYIPAEDPPEGSSIQDVCQTDCEGQYNCGNPQICQNSDRYISEVEADTCLVDWAALSCRDFERATNCGRGFAYCPRPETCSGEVLCDPADWE